MEQQQKRPWVRLLTNESTIGTFALLVIAGLALWFDAKEIAGVAVGGIAAMLRNKEGQD